MRCWTNRLVCGAFIWFVGAQLGLYVLLQLLSSFGSRKRFLTVVLDENWQVTVPALALMWAGYEIMIRARRNP